MRQNMLWVAVLCLMVSWRDEGNAQPSFTIADSASFYTFLDSFDQHHPPDTLEGGVYNQMQRIRMIWGPRLAPDGKMDRVHTARTAYVRAYGVPSTTGTSRNTTPIVLPSNHPSAEDWAELGNTSNLLGGNRRTAKGTGQMHRIAFHPQFGSSNQMVYAGSHYGGLFRSDNGGTSWYNYHTDRGLPMTSIGGVAASSAYVYVCTGNGDYAFSDYGASARYDPNFGSLRNLNPLHTQGVYRCGHSSTQWQSINGTNVILIDSSTKSDLLAVFEAGGTMREIAVHPTNPNLLLIATSHGIFRTANGGQTWRQVLVGPPNGTGGNLWDHEWRGLVFHPTNPDTVYASGKDIYCSTDAGLTWVSMTGGQGLDTSTTRINLAVTKAEPDWVYAHVAVPGSNWVYRHNGTTWNTGYVDDRGFNDGNGNADWLGIAVHPANKHIVYIGGLRAGRTNNYGSSGTSFTNLAGHYHDDVHALVFAPNDSSLYLATHGSISGGNIRAGDRVVELYEGLGVSTVWAFDDWEGNDSFLIVANQDIGINHTHTKGAVWTSQYEVGDGYSVRVNNQDGVAYLKGNNYWGAYQTHPGPHLVAVDNYSNNNEDQFDVPRVNYDFSDPNNPQFGHAVGVHNVFPAENHPKDESFYFGLTELYQRHATRLSNDQVPILSVVNTVRYLGPRYNTNWNQVGPATGALCSENGTFVGLDTIAFGSPSVVFYRVDTLCAIQTTDVDYAAVYSQLWGLSSYLEGHQPIWQRRRITEIAFSEDEATDYTYLATVGDPGNHRCGFYFKDQASHCDTCFINLTPNIPYDATIVNNEDPNPITGIAVDPLDGNRVWISMSGYSKQLKVLYSANAGQTWSSWDDSTGALAALNVPINNIVYQRGTKDRLYIATDVGVYVREGQGPWWRYGENFPNVRVTELKINYCVGKLRAATFGRGVWENDLLPVEETAAYRSFRLVNSYETWDQDKHLSRDLWIKSGARLTLKNMTLNMPKGGLIIVEQGGELWVDSSTITNLCGQTWQGIQIWGETDQPQQRGFQGFIRLSHATVSHAREAISPWEVGRFPRPDGTGGTGGIIEAENSRFINNWRTAGFMQYRYGDRPEASYFRNCTFTVNDNSRQDFLGHLSFWDVGGTYVQGCTFEDQRTDKPGSAYGLYALAAGVYVYRDGTTGQGNHFEGLDRGIEIGNYSRRYDWLVDQTSFRDNLKAFIGRAAPGVRILRNQFEIGTYAPYTNPNARGVSLLRTGSFVVEQNRFERSMGANPYWPNIGLWIDDCKTNAHQVRNDTFIGMTHANLVHGEHQDDLDGSGGLKYFCNYCHQNTADLVVNQSMQHPYGSSISQQQGSQNQPARNTFSNPPIYNFMAWQLYNDGSASPAYVHYTAPQTTILNRCVAGFRIERVTNLGRPSFCDLRYNNRNVFVPSKNSGPLGLAALQQNYRQAKQQSQQVLHLPPVDTAQQALLEHEAAYWAREIIHYYKKDTAIGSMDSVAVWLKTFSTLPAQYELVEHFWGTKQYQQAFDLLQTIQVQHALGGHLLANHRDYTILKDVLYGVYEDNRNEALLKEEELNLLQEIADRDHGEAALQAANIINFFYTRAYVYEPTLPGTRTEELVLPVDTLVSPQLTVYPNPARTWAVVEYQLPEETPTGMLQLIASNGQLLLEQPLQQATGTVSLALEPYPSGVYWIYIQDMDSIKKLKAILVVKK